MQNHYKQTLLCSAIAALLLVGTAKAADRSGQEPDNAPASDQQGAARSDASQGAVKQLQDVVVTARKQAESLQDAPVAVTAVSRTQLENHLATDLTKASELAPQVSMSQGGSSTGAVITVRGVSTPSNDAGLDQSVAIVIDGVPVSRGEVISTSLFDMDQIQVLQGPQALFFGKNSPAGVISLKSADPTDSLEGYVTLGYETETENKYLEGAVSGPLTSTLKARLAVRGSKQSEGWMKNNAEPAVMPFFPTVTDPGATMGKYGPNDDIRAGRLTLLWEPNDSFSANFKLMGNTQKRNSGNPNTEPFCIGSTTVPVLSGVPIPDADCEKNQQKAHGSVAPIYVQNVPQSNGGVPYFDSTYTFSSLTLDKKWRNFDLVSTTGYFDQTQKALTVSDWSTFATIWATDKHTYKEWNEEVRLHSSFDGPVNFMVGGYYEDYSRGFWNAVDIFHVYDPVAQNYLSDILDADTDGTYTAVFGQVVWKIVSNVELSAGARWSDDKKTTRLQNLQVGPSYAAALLPVGSVLKADYSDKHVSPEVTLSWHPAEDHTLYAAYKTGYKAGGISVPFFVYNYNTPQNMGFKPEEARGFEIGFKAESDNHRLRYDISAYRYNYSDLQVSSYDPNTISFVITNAATAKIDGVQGSLEWMAADSLTLRANLGYNRARYTDYKNAQCYSGQTVQLGCVVAGTTSQQDLTNKSLLRAPKFTYSVGGDWNPQLSQNWYTTLSLNAAYSGGFFTAGDYAPASWQEAYWLVSAAVRVAPVNGHWEVALIGRNLTNSYYMLNSNGWTGAGNPDQQVGFFNPPREIAVQATWRF